jgi:hypothetical protein
MKRKLFSISAASAILLALGLVLASCDTGGGGGGGGDPSVFFYTWSGTLGERAATITFKPDLKWFLMHPSYYPAGYEYEGDYTVSGSTATLTRKGEDTGTAVVTGDSLELSFTAGAFRDKKATFTKQ